MLSNTPVRMCILLTSDLYGVVCFLGIEPITDIDWWNILIMEPFKLANSQITITSNLFGQIFWRTEKEDVQDQVETDVH